MQRKTRVQHCSSCKNHGKISAKKNHKCNYQDCKCILCELLQRSQKVMRHQQRVWRHQKLKLRPDNRELENQSNLLDQSGKAKCQVCDKCRNHNKLVPKRNHQCNHAQCCCVYCNLTSKRRDLMKYLQRVRRSGVISDANPEVRKARKFLEDNELQFEFADDESGATDEDDVQEVSRLNVDDLEETHGDGQQLIVSEERVSPAGLPNQGVHHPKKQRLLNFREGKSDSPFLQESLEAQSLDHLDSPQSNRITFTGAKQLTSKRFGDEIKMRPLDSSFQAREVVDTFNQTTKLRSPINSSPPPLIQMPSRPSSAEGELTVTDFSYQRGEKIHRIQDHNSVLKRLSLESSSPTGYPVHIGRADEEEPRMPSMTHINSTSLSRLPLPISSTDMPLYIEASQPIMQGNLSPNHLQHLRLQYAALFMCQRSPMKFAIHQEDFQLRNTDWSNQSPSLRNYQNITQPVVRPLPLPINASHPYSPMHSFGNNSQWNQRNMHIRPNFMSEDTGTSSLPRPFTDSSKRSYMLNHF